VRLKNQSYCKVCTKANRKTYISTKKPKVKTAKVVVIREYLSERREQEIVDNHNPVLFEALRRMKL
jgi:hypothetical protein